MSQVRIVVDARGLRCPLPILRLARIMRIEPAARYFALLSDDPATAVELQAWARETGHGVSAVGASFEIDRAAA